MIFNPCCVQAKGEHILILCQCPVNMLGVWHNTGEIDRDFLGDANLAQPGDIFRGYGLAFIIPSLL